MGCSSSQDLNVSDRNQTSTSLNQQLAFTKQEKYLLRKTWKIIGKSLSDLGANIFTTIFGLKPEIKDFFPWETPVEYDLSSDVRFRSHASRFVQVFASAVENINVFDEVMAPSLITLGENHVGFFEYNESYFEVFIASVLKEFENELEDGQTDEIANVWRKLVDLVLSKFKEGFKRKC